MSGEKEREREVQRRRENASARVAIRQSTEATELSSAEELSTGRGGRVGGRLSEAEAVSDWRLASSEHAPQATAGVICHKLFGSSFRTEIKTSQIFRTKKITTTNYFTQIVQNFQTSRKSGYRFWVLVSEHIARNYDDHWIRSQDTTRVGII